MSGEGFTAVALGWFVMSVFGAIPFVLTREIPFYIDALFETISGFTTTGSSILVRCGGIKLCQPVLAQLHPLDRRYGCIRIHYGDPADDGWLHYEPDACGEPGPSVSKLVPRVRDTAKILYGIYLAITILG